MGQLSFINIEICVGNLAQNVDNSKFSNVNNAGVQCEKCYKLKISFNIF